MRHIYNTKPAIHELAELVNNIPNDYVELLFKSLVLDVDNIIVDSDLSLEDACEEALESREFSLFEHLILISAAMEEYEAEEDGIILNDFFDHYGDYTENEAIERLAYWWKRENPNEVRRTRFNND